jgi:hypothetical protein
MIRLLAKQVVGLIVGAAVALALALAVPTAAARWLAAPAAAPAANVVAAAPVAPMLHYQGRLLDPTTGQAKADGAYAVVFRLYGTATGGSPLWVESKSVTVSRGLFATLLGDTTALDLAQFDGRELYLGVTVGSDPEAQPRQRIAFVAYALYAANAHTLAGKSAAEFAAASHSHDGSAITSGIIAEARIDPAIARDSEIVPAVSASGQFASATHDHDATYVNLAGDTMTGELTVPKINYANPRTHYFMVGSEGFVPGSNVPYANTYSNGGAYFAQATSGAMVAPVHLPHGATITEFQVFYYDNSSSDMTVYLARQYMTGGGYQFMSSVSTSGASNTYRNGSSTSIVAPVVDNTLHSYHIYAYSASWPGTSDLRIKGALVTYTIEEAP